MEAVAFGKVREGNEGAVEREKWNHGSGWEDDPAPGWLAGVRTEHQPQRSEGQAAVDEHKQQGLGGTGHEQGLEASVGRNEVSAENE